KLRADWGVVSRPTNHPPFALHCIISLQVAEDSIQCRGTVAVASCGRHRARLRSVAGRGAAGRSNHGTAHRERAAYAVGHLRQEHLPAVQLMAAGARLVRTSERAVRAPHLVVRNLRLWI